MNAREISDELAGELLTPDYRIENVTTALTDNTFYGVAGLRAWVSETFEGLDEETRYDEEILADGEDFVVARMRLVGHGTRSGIPVTLRWVGVFWFQDGKFSRTAGYSRRREALEAVGLEG